jgi:hypothetical protein
MPTSSTMRTTPAGLVAVGVARAAARAVPRRPTPLPQGGLTAVALTGASGLTDAGGAALLRMRGVTAVDVSRCPRVTAAALRPPLAPTLTSITAHACRGLHAVSLEGTAAPALTSLSLAGCAGLTAVSLALPRLETLSVAGAAALASLDLACPSLTTLNAASCGSLTSLWGEGGCDALVDVNLFGCRALPSSALEPALARCSRLARLVVNGGTALTRIRVPSRALAALDAAGCGGVAEVGVAGDALTTLSLNGCAVLARLLVDGAAPRLVRLELEGTGRLGAEARAAVEALVAAEAG